MRASPFDTLVTTRRRIRIAVRPAAVLLVVLGAVLAPMAAQAAAGFAAPQQIAVGGDPAMLADAAGHDHVAYVNKGVRYATDKSGSWVSAPVSKPPVGTLDIQPSLALDSHGKAYIAFERLDLQTSASVGLYVATNKSGTWVVSRLTRSGDSGQSIAVDSRGWVTSPTSTGARRRRSVTAPTSRGAGSPPPSRVRGRRSCPR